MMEREAVKELVHIKGWPDRVDEIVKRGKGAYLADDLLQEDGDALMMKLGEAANRLSRLDILAPDGRRPGARRREPELHHPPVRRDQPRADLGDALAGSARVEAIARGPVLGCR